MAGSSITTALGDLGGLGSAGLAWLETRMVGLLAEGSIWTTGMPAAKSNHAGPIDSDYAFITIICTIVFVPITIALVYFAFRYKKAPGEKAESDVSHNTPLEVTWTVIPMLIVVVMFYIGFRHANMMYAAPADAYTVHVTASQWSWSFLHPSGAQMGGDIGKLSPDRKARETTDPDLGLHLPPGVPIRLVMNSTDVLHSFYIPEFRVKQDVVPGKTSSLWFTPDLPEGDEPDMYWLLCTEYCGKDHSNMLSAVYVHPTMESFLQWQTRATALDPDNPVESGAKLYVRKGCATCHSVAPDGSGPNTGPTWSGLWGLSADEHQVHEGSPTGPKRGVAMTGEAGEEYLRESIRNPTALWREGYIQPMAAVKVDDTELFFLIEYIKSLGKQ
jgi:cytochrome c oxidase subunit 2